jgi:hypothetical protein
VLERWARKSGQQSSKKKGAPMRHVPGLAVALLGALAVVTSCSEKAEESAGGGAAPAAEEKVVHIYNWANYIEPSLLEKFTTETSSTAHRFPTGRISPPDPCPDRTARSRQQARRRLHVGHDWDRLQRGQCPSCSLT